MKAFALIIIMSLMSGPVLADGNNTAKFKGDCLRSGGKLAFENKEWKCLKEVATNLKGVK